MPCYTALVPALVRGLRKCNRGDGRRFCLVLTLLAVTAVTYLRESLTHLAAISKETPLFALLLSL